MHGSYSKGRHRRTVGASVDGFASPTDRLTNALICGDARSYRSGGVRSGLCSPCTA